MLELPVGTLLEAAAPKGRKRAGSFLSTEYPGSSKGVRFDSARALVLAACQQTRKVHYFVVIPRPGDVLLFGWIQDLTRWKRLA